MKTTISLVVGLLLGATCWAQDPEPQAATSAPEPPPLPPKVTAGDQLEPAVTITVDEEGQIVEEYRQNGQIYMVKVTPENLPPYYLIDMDGDGQFESDLNPPAPVQPVYWKVAEWD